MTQSVLNTFKKLNIGVEIMGLLFIKIWHSQFSKTRFRLIKITFFIERINYKKFRSKR